MRATHLSSRLGAAPPELPSNPRVHGGAAAAYFENPSWRFSVSGIGRDGRWNKGRSCKDWGTHTQLVALVIHEPLCETNRKVWNYWLTNLYTQQLRFCPTHNLPAPCPQICFLCHSVGNFHSTLNPPSPIPSHPPLQKNCSSSVPWPGVRAVEIFCLKVGKKAARKTSVTHCSMWFT